MTHHRSASRLARLVSFATALWLGLGWPALAAQPDPSPAAPGTENPTLDSLEQLQRQLQELRQQITGMEDKLRESARARKGADQARMEAERRLAEGSQALEQAQEELMRLQSAQGTLEQQVSDQQGLIDKLGTQLQSEHEEKARLTSQLERLRSRLPEAEGGALTADAAREAAVAAYRALKDRLDQPDAVSPEDRAKSIAEAETKLHSSQLRLARVLDARSVYRVRTNDSLGLISSRFYGTSAEWRRLFEANRHILSDPDALTPGITLVIP